MFTEREMFLLKSLSQVKKVQVQSEAGFVFSGKFTLAENNTIHAAMRPLTFFCIKCVS